MVYRIVNKWSKVYIIKIKKRSIVYRLIKKYKWKKKIKNSKH